MNPNLIITTILFVCVCVKIILSFSPACNLLIDVQHYWPVVRAIDLIHSLYAVEPPMVVPGSMSP